MVCRMRVSFSRPLTALLTAYLQSPYLSMNFDFFLFLLDLFLLCLFGIDSQKKKGSGWGSRLSTHPKEWHAIKAN